MIREFRQSDLEWIEPIAREWGEWEEAKKILMDKGTFALVLEPAAVIAMYEDEHGVVVAGTCSKKGIKPFYRVANEVNRLAQNNGVDLHSHCTDKNSWQYKFLTKYFEFSDYAGMLTQYAVRET